MRLPAPLEALEEGGRLGDPHPVTDVPVLFTRQALEVGAVLSAVGLPESIRRIDRIGHEAPACHQVVVGAPAHAQQLVLTGRIVQQIDGGDQIEGAQPGEGRGVAHL